MKTLTETCANCGVAIGNLEDAFVWKDQPVCPGCYARLNPPVLAYGTAAPLAALPSSRSVVIEQTSKKWKAWLTATAMAVPIGLVVCLWAAFHQHDQLMWSGVWLCGGGLLAFVIVTFLAWWHHG